MQNKEYFVYMMTNKYNKVLYAGVTGNLIKRVREHKTHVFKGWTNKYNAEKLVYYETFDDMSIAIHREKQSCEFKKSRMD